jgi:hypothetical protein
VLVVFPDPPPFANQLIQLSFAEADQDPSPIRPGTSTVGARWRAAQFVPYEIIGKAFNRGADIAYNVSIIAVCYDSERRVVAVASGHPRRLTLGRGELSPFRLEILHSAAEVALCKVHAVGALP